MSTWDWQSGFLDITLWHAEGMQELNKDLLGHNYNTDVISLDLTSGPIQAYVLHLGMDCIMENARLESVTVEEECRRCTVHGLLHMKGMNDQTEEEKTTMRDEEDHWLQLFHVEHGQ